MMPTVSKSGSQPRRSFQSIECGLRRLTARKRRVSEPHHCWMNSGVLDASEVLRIVFFCLELIQMPRGGLNYLSTFNRMRTSFRRRGPGVNGGS